MDVWRITVAALRRWYVLVPLLGLTALMVFVVGRGVEPEYDVTGATMVVPGPSLQDIPNPYGGPSDANNALAIVLNSPETRAEIADQGLVASYQVAPQSRSTIMNFEVRAASPQQAVETGIAVFQKAATELVERQTAAGIRPTQQYSIDVLQTPSVSAAVTDGKLRNMAVVGVLGGAISLALAVFFDDVVGLLRRRSRRRAEAAPAVPHDDAGDTLVAADVPADHGRPNAAPVATAGPTDARPIPIAATSRPGPRAQGGAGNGPRKPKQPRKAKKAAATDRVGAGSARRGTAASDAP